jgi:hypothetical protein
MMARKPASKDSKPKKEKSAAERIAEPVKKAGDAIRKSAGKAVENSVAINTTVINHAEANAREAFAAMRKVATAKSVQDVVKVQTQFVKEQSARSAAQVREVGELIASFGRDALSMMRGK